MNNIRKIFSVFIHEKEYDVYSIEGKKHNGEDSNWWVYLSDILPNGIVPPHDSSYLHPYSYSILRRCWDIKVKQTNTSKLKWDEMRFSNHTSVEMWCNKKLIYSFGTGGKNLDFAFAKIQYLQVIINEHPYNFFEPETEIGRKICWYGLPATILNGYEPGEIRIKPDYTAGLSKELWWKELKNRKSIYTNKTEDNLDMDEIEKEYDDEYENSDVINWGDALSDEHIYWFRK